MSTYFCPKCQFDMPDELCKRCGVPTKLAMMSSVSVDEYNALRAERDAVLKEERELRKWAKEYLHLYPERSKLLLKDITALVRAVREDETNKSAERGFAEYLRMFGDGPQSIIRAGQIAAAIRSKK